jgi:hypothetical protein
MSLQTPICLESITACEKFEIQSVQAGFALCSFDFRRWAFDAG